MTGEITNRPRQPGFETRAVHAGLPARRADVDRAALAGIRDGLYPGAVVVIGRDGSRDDRRRAEPGMRLRR